MTIRGVDDLVAAVRAASGEVVTVEINGAADPLALATMVAAIGPLAIERAPGMRVNAVVVEDAASSADVAAAVAFLDGARSTTGQVLRVRPQAPRCASTKA